jgi:hypothetical protein
MSLRKTSCLALGLLLAASAAQAASYTVTLSNGTSFETRYRPMTAEWDTNYAMLRTDQGNWIALKKAEIVDVTSASELSGFGYQINDTTVFLGWSAAEGLTGEDGAGDTAGGAAPDTGTAPAAGSAPAADSSAPAPGGGYTMQQFVSVPTTGVVPGGIPLGGTTSGGRPGS